MHYFILIMHEISFQEGYYGQKYSDTLPQAILEGVHYERGSLKFQFKKDDGSVCEKITRDPLEMLILSEILYGSELWKYKASVSNYQSYHQNRDSVSLIVEPDESYVSTYKDTSVGFKVYLSTMYDKLKSYGGYESYPKLREISYPSYCQPIEQPDNFKIDLFDYQKKSVAKMLAIERKTIDLECNYNYPMEFGEVSINYNPRVGKGEDNDIICQLKIETNGGILADEMGLGKTITSLALVSLNPSTYTQQYKNNLLYSNATLIVCPSHLSKQWESEVKRVFPKAKIIKLLTKNNHVKLTYQSMKDADIIIVTQQFLMNFKYYPQVHYQYCTPSNFTFSSRINKLSEVLRGWRDDDDVDIMKQTQPNLEHFHFHRLIVDEGHEIFGLQLTNASMARYMAEWLSQVKSDYKWFVSGTPFVNYEGLKKCMEFINLKLVDKKSGEDFTDLQFINKTYIIDSLLSNVMIRHRKIDVDNQIQIPGYEEEVIWVKLTELEKNLYISKKNNHVSDITLQQLCCHILISDTTSRYFGSNTEVDLSQMQDTLIEYHKSTIVTYENKLACLKPENQAYAMIKKNYQTKISESRYMLTILEKMAKKDEIDLDQNCSICFDTLNNPSLTPCGHIFCKECLEMCLQVKKECPMCKSDLAGKEIYLVDSKKEEEQEPEEENPLIKKYGSKLGKLISIVRTLITNDNNRIIIFSQWDRMLNLIGKSLSDNGVANSFIKGNVWSRNSAISKFKLGKDASGEDNKVIMLSLSNSASGTNLTEATHIIFVEPINSKFEEVKAIEGQAIGRACRLGQKNKVKVIRILTHNTIEEQIYDNIYSKNLDNIKRTIMIDDGNLGNNIIV
mgnify:CR=1 FL=1